MLDLPSPPDSSRRSPIRCARPPEEANGIGNVAAIGRKGSILDMAWMLANRSRIVRNSLHYLYPPSSLFGAQSREAKSGTAGNVGELGERAEGCRRWHWSFGILEHSCAILFHHLQGSVATHSQDLCVCSSC